MDLQRKCTERWAVHDFLSLNLHTGFFHNVSQQEKENLCNLEKKYSSVSGGKGFPVSPSSLKEVKNMKIGERE